MPLALDTPLAEVPFVVVDVETTGMKPPFARITEVAAVKLRGGEMGLELAHLVDPGCPIPPFITAMTGISDAMVRGQPTIDALWPLLDEFWDGTVLVAHNAPFDLAFLDAEALRLSGQPLPNLEVCTVHLSRRAWPRLRSHSLDAVASHLGLTFGARHRALGDARVTARVLLRALETLAPQGLATLGDLLRCQRSARCRARLRALFGVSELWPHPGRRRVKIGDPAQR